MGIFGDAWTRIWSSILDNRNKLTATGGVLVGVLLTLTFKDLYPDLELAFRQRLKRIRAPNPPHAAAGDGALVHLEDHTGRRNSIYSVDGSDPRRTKYQDFPLGVEGLVGNTPLIELRSLSRATGCQILAKAEFLNGAGNSPKDRVAVSMINVAEEEGLLKPGRGDTVYEGTVGSTGISLAAICRARGYTAHICMPDDQAEEKVTLLHRLGATVERVRPVSIVDPNQFVNLARRRAAEHTASTTRPGHGFFADQFENTANYLAHQTSTGPELLRQTDGHFDAFIAGAGTGGTISGVALALKQPSLLPDLRVILADPQGSGLYNKVKYGVMFSPTEAEGTRRRHQVDSIVEGVGINRLTANFRAGMHLIDDAVRVHDTQAMMMARWLVEREGLFVGASSAVNCVAAAKVARDAVAGVDPGSRIVTVLCDSGTRHLSRFWKQAGELEGQWELDDILDWQPSG